MDREKSGWSAAVGAFVVLGLLNAIAITAAAGWDWVAAFLQGPAGSWAQAIGGGAAVYAAFEVGNRQARESRRLEAERRAEAEYVSNEIVYTLFLQPLLILLKIKPMVAAKKIDDIPSLHLGQLEDFARGIREYPLTSLPLGWLTSPALVAPKHIEELQSQLRTGLDADYDLPAEYWFALLDKMEAVFKPCYLASSRLHINMLRIAQSGELPAGVLARPSLNTHEKALRALDDTAAAFAHEFGLNEDEREAYRSFSSVRVKAPSARL